MEEPEVNYTSVVFKATVQSSSAVKREEGTVYDEVKMRSQTTKATADANAFRRGRCWHLACCLGILCFILLLSIIGVSVHLAQLTSKIENPTALSQQSDLNWLRENQSTLLAVNQNLTDLKHDLNSKIENLKREHDNLTDQLDNLTQSYTAVKSEITNLTAENRQLEAQNQELEAQNQELGARNQELETQNQKLENQSQELERQRNNLIENMETEWNEHNVSRAQWSIDAYCPIENITVGVRECRPCEQSWISYQSSCYAMNYRGRGLWRTWESAKTNCRERISDLAVITDEDEKVFIETRSNSVSDLSGYWIGLKAEEGKWKWVNGSDLMDESWIQEPAADGHCAVSLKNVGLKSVNCTEENRWICKKNSLSV